LGRVISVSTQINAAAAPIAVASSITYAPFGPLTGLTFGNGNGIVLGQSYDQDYRLTGVNAAGVQNPGYSYDVDDNITSISDAITPARHVTFR